MKAQPGQQLLHYRLVDKIGEGGMGEVWRAEDDSLGRQVAIKMLPDTFAEDPDRLARFEREARLLASLNHPNIAGVHGLHEVEGLRFLAMELVAGQDLSQRLAAGPLMLEDALRAALQVTEALEAAHENGVIHRDLKPANVQVAPDGICKVLDFGLAKAIDIRAASGSGSERVMPTVTSAGTHAGVILGTAAYMSPEQARGKPVDRRTDIWSFGCLLYEMLTGQKAFRGETNSDLMASILKEDPNWRELPDGTPPRIVGLLQRCLRRDPRLRLRDIGDARVEIGEVLAGDLDEQAATTKPGARAGTRLAWGVAALFAVAALAVGWQLARLPEARPAADLSLAVPLPDEAPLSLWGQNLFTFPSLAISPAGDKIAYVASVGGDEQVDQLYLRALDGFEVTPLTGTEFASSPSFSPDGNWIAFTADNKIKKIAVSGGLPVELADAPGSAPGLHWGDDDSIVFAPRWSGGLWRVPAAGGPAEQITELEPSREELGHRWPQLLPGSKHVIYSTKTTPIRTHDDAIIGVTSLETGESRVLVEGGFFPRYVSSGHLIYGRDAKLYAVAFDVERAETVGTPVLVLEGVITSPVTGVAHYDVSVNGTLIYLPGEPAGLDAVPTWFDRNGVREPIAVAPDNFMGPKVSPDGRRLVTNVTAANDKLWTYDFERETRTRLTADAGNDTGQLWSPDSRRVVFSNDRLGRYNLYVIPVDGSSQEELLFESDVSSFSSSWSPDGTRLLMDRFDTETGTDLWVLPLEPESEPEVFLRTPSTERRGIFSPDGRWVAYISDESGRDAVYVRPFPGPGGKIQISGDHEVRDIGWAPDGRELYYTTDKAMLAVPIDLQPEFRPGRAHRLFEFDGRFNAAQFDVAPTGDRFLFVPVDADRSTRDHLRIVLGWTDRL